ncbi:hypothetical protein PIB30_044299 [Stylosanthes scabra]|uniref:Pentatricopeptide repeat-containing protein n=1 Tax=Stylosanthes scabra TaxID=79078 RepID=A0ABU6VEU4_9FABA|nr:hypothetical protein [Stylosanthes scabra]
MAFPGTTIRATLSSLSRAFFFSSSFLTRTHTSLLQPPPISVFCSRSHQHPKSYNFHFTTRPFTSKKPNTTKTDTKLNFSLSDSDSDEDSVVAATEENKNSIKGKLPPPYDPFSKKLPIEEPEDPKDLQGIFHNMRSGDGLMNHAVKMFDALSKEGLTHVALELFAEIKDKGHVPDVVAHTAIVEAYANAGRPKEALNAHMRMLASGIAPNAYSYAVLMKGLAGGKFLKDAKRFLLEMMDKGMRPNAETYTAVFEGLVREGKVDEARELLGQMKGKGFVPDENAVREVMRHKHQRGPIFRTVMSVLFGK